MPAEPCSGINSATSTAESAARCRCARCRPALVTLSQGALRDWRLHTPTRGRLMRSNRKEPPLVQDLAQALSRAERCLVRQLTPALVEEGCSVEQWRVLVLLADGRGHGMTELAEFALVPAPSLTRLVDRMVADGLVHR